MLGAEKWFEHEVVKGVHLIGGWRTSHVDSSA